MSATPYLIRDAKLEDMSAVHAIFSHYILHSTANFEETPPSLEEFTQRFLELTQAGYPYRVLEIEQIIAGLAYIGPYRKHSGWRFCVENTIYLHPDYCQQGLGSQLLADLLQCCEAAQRWHTIMAVLGGTDMQGSYHLHRKYGFSETARQLGVGYKFNQWLDSITLQKNLSSPIKALS
ncbi:GNAT family N-acetyltransferase [Brackiella oedipodis]|uniref:GNAT family N-acetyltransferase n=1 Tax=Brackiella oedipodis TaxID=124225 RepID=UPI00048A70A6|nr:GNAT family N-acetyltransferase [Brackiella oedipodis]